MWIYLQKIKNNKQFLAILFFLIMFLLLVICGRYFAPHDPYKLHYDHILESSSYRFPMGTDQMGRCVFSRVLYGGRDSLIIIISIVFITAIIGIFIGISSALIGGMVDVLIMRVTDMLLAFPGIIFIIALIAVLGIGNTSIFVSMTMLGWMQYARVSRALTLEIKMSNFIAQARLGGASHLKLVRKYIVPSVMPHILVLMSQNMGSLLLTFCSLSLLGLGSQPPNPEWGYMLSEGKKFMQEAPWLLYFPGMAILICVINFNLLGDSLGEMLDLQTTVVEKKKGRIL